LVKVNVVNDDLDFVVEEIQKPLTMVKVNVVNDDLDFVVEEIQKPLTKAERKAMKHALALPSVTTNAET